MILADWYTEGRGGQQGWIFSIYGLIATIPSSCYKDPPKILVQNTEMEHKKQHERRIWTSYAIWRRTYSCQTGDKTGVHPLWMGGLPTCRFQHQNWDAAGCKATDGYVPHSWQERRTSIELKRLRNSVNKIIQLGNMRTDVKYFGSNPQPYRVFSANGIAPTLNTCSGGGREPKILVRLVQKKWKNQSSLLQEEECKTENGYSNWNREVEYATRLLP